MKNKSSKFLLALLVLFFLSFIGIKLYDYFAVDERFEFSNVKVIDSNKVAVPSSEFDEKDLDSVFHKDICLDYNNIWVSKDYKKVVCFEYNSGKLLVYKKNERIKDFSKLVETPANDVFSWNFNEKRSDNKIIGEITYTDKDSVMYWIYDKSNSVLKDDKGLVFNKIKINKNE